MDATAGLLGAADIIDPPIVDDRPWYCAVEDCDGKPHAGFEYKHARAKQRPPLASWFVWAVKAGRGFGKTRTGAEFVKQGAPQPLASPGTRWALVARTFPDGRDTMVEGESGLLAVLPPSLLIGGSVERSWNRSLGELKLANGSRAKIYTSERPAQLRGPQHHGAWGDEPAFWLDATKAHDAENTTWSNLLLGLRLGHDPRIVLTYTPNRVALLLRGRRDHPGIEKLSTTRLTRGSTYENLDNLAPTFLETVVKPQEGTRAGRQELYAEDLDDVEGALWKTAQIEEGRRLVPPSPQSRLGDLHRVIVAVDPSGGDKATNDEQGIVVVGLGTDGEAYVLADRSCKLSPDGWGRRAVQAWLDFEADRIVAEANYGGDMVLSTVQVAATAMANEGRSTRSVPVKIIHAARGKRQRAEPVAALYGDPDRPDSWRKSRVHHVEVFAELEAEQTSWTPESGQSPNRLDALVWALSDLMLGPVRTTRRRYRDSRLQGRR